MPDHDVAVEFDGPSHYYHNSTGSSSTSRDASRTKTAKTALRDFFLAKQCAKVVTVPSFAKVKNSPEKRRLYVKEKLAKEAGVTIAKEAGVNWCAPPVFELTMMMPRTIV
jgi:hypothetical protein